MRKHNAKPISQTGSSPHARLLENGSISIKRCRHGLFMYNLNDKYVSHSLDVYGEWSESDLTCLGQMLKSGDVVIDVGANIGTHTVFLSQKIAPGGMVFALEPQRVTFELLCANIAMNSLLNVIPMRVAVSDGAGEMIIPVLDPSINQNFAALNIEGHSDGDLVKVLQLDTLELRRCNLIKIDVEGMELQVLRGAQKTIQDCRPFLFVENHNTEGSPEILQLLFEAGYKCWWHFAHYYNPHNFFQKAENIWADFGPEANMICVPAEFNLNISGFEPVINTSDTFVQALTRLRMVSR